MIDFGVTERKVAELKQRMKRCQLYEKDIEEKFVRSSGPGGQKVNIPFLNIVKDDGIVFHFAICNTQWHLLV